MFQEGVNSQMVKFNRDLADKRLLAINEFVSRAEQGDESKRKAWQEELWKILSVADLNLNDVREILAYFKIDLMSDKLPSLKELSEMLIPVPEEEGAAYEVTNIGDVFVRTDKVERPVTKGGETPFKKKETIERGQMLVDFLKENGIEVKSYHILKGKNTHDMMRKESYLLFIVPSIDSMVLVCDEEGNVTFVIRDLPAVPKQYYKLTKSELKAHPKVAPHIRWSDQQTWEMQILDALTDPRTTFDKETVALEKVGLIEDLSQLKKEVRDAGVKSLGEYLRERKKHSSWPHNPDTKFKDTGWVSWPDLFGKEVVELIDDLEQLKREVIEVGIRTSSQYHEEQKKHPSWPSTPDIRFKNRGWVSWPDLFGKETVELIDDLEQLKSEVRAADIRSKDQYFEEAKKYPH